MPGPAMSANWKMPWSTASSWPKGPQVEVTDLPVEIRDMHGTGDAHEQAANRTSIVTNEKKLLLDVLQETGWNKKLSAQKLGISRSTLYNKLKKYAIRKDRRK